MVPLAHATSEVSDEPAHPHSLARGITAHIQIEGTCLKLDLKSHWVASDKKNKCSKKRLVYDPSILKFATSYIKKLDCVVCKTTQAQISRSHFNSGHVLF